MPATSAVPSLVNHDHDHDHEYMAPDMVPDVVPVSVLPLAEGLSSGRVREAWSCLARESDNLRAVYQTPSWCAYQAVGGEPINLALLLDPADEVIGVTPLQHTTFELIFSVRNRVLWRKTFAGLVMMGGQPLLPSCRRTYDGLFRAIRGTFPDRDCLCLGEVPLDSYLWVYLENSAEIRSCWHRFEPHRGVVRHHWLSLPSTFAEYLAKFSSRTRNTFKRERQAVDEARRRFLGTNPRRVARRSFRIHCMCHADRCRRVAARGRQDAGEPPLFRARTESSRHCGAWPVAGVRVEMRRPPLRLRAWFSNRCDVRSLRRRVRPPVRAVLPGQGTLVLADRGPVCL